MINPKEYFDQQISSRLQRALTKSVLENCREASRFCFRHFAAPQAKDLSGDFRRAKIEDEFAGIAGLFRDVSVSIQKYPNGTGSYNELKVGSVKITQSCIQDVDVVPRQAEFRVNLARDGQFSLWTGKEEEPEKNGREDDDFLYAILTYGIDVKATKRSWPAFIKFQFPNDSFTRYVCEGIDMFQRFPDLVAEYVPKPRFEYQLKRKQRRKAAGE